MPDDPTPLRTTSASLVLWDVDHTLIEAGPVGRAVYRTAFELLVGRQPVEGPRTDGRTDLAIMSDLFGLNGIAPIASARVIEALAASASSLRADLAAGGRALPGAAECLAALATAPGVVQSVLTGNIEPNARLKLATFGLGEQLDFAVGGYGSDSTVRADLVPIARGKARERYGIDPSVIVLVGDTLRDVEAGRDGGALVLGVATGAFTTTELRAAGADAALESLADPTAFLSTLATLSPP